MPFDPNDPDTKAALEAAITKATEPLKESISKLEGKNEELVGENRKLKRGAEIKPEDLQAAEDRADKAEKALDDANKTLKAVTGERDKAVKSLETESAYTSKLLIQDGLKSALIAAGVKDEDFLDTLTAKFSSSAQVVTKGDERTAMIGDKSLSDHISEWAGSDAGKKFVAAPANGGGGAGGGGGGGSQAKAKSEAEVNSLSPKDRAAFFADGGTIARAA
ncbi:MAG: hypothetical protein J7496_08600 [Novosphingobium sp.]|nr:hypothetical protein [Novosphingobium sp.]